MPSKANTYRAVLIGLAIIIVAFVGYFVYRGIVGTKKVVQNSPVNAVISPTGANQTIKENAPISNTPNGNANTHGIIPITGNGSTNSGSGTTGTSGNGISGSNSGTVPNGYDTANYGPQNGNSPCNGLDEQNTPECQAQQVPPTATKTK